MSTLKNSLYLQQKFWQALASIRSAEQTSGFIDVHNQIMGINIFVDLVIFTVLRICKIRDNSLTNKLCYYKSLFDNHIISK